jgi:XTP/dITP diphosphohydrolase
MTDAGSRQHPVAELVEVMDRLRSAGGCPWDAQQTHQTLVPYLLEECYETIDAIEGGDDEHLREELGDLLLQVVFHSRIGEESDPPWGIDTVAAGIVAKLIRRHPHVFGDARADDAEQVAANWTLIKAEEKSRTSALEGIPLALPSLSLAQKSWRRAVDCGVAPNRPGASVSDPEELADQLLALAVHAEEQGWDAESLLRRRVAGLHRQVRQAESGPAPG